MNSVLKSRISIAVAAAVIITVAAIITVSLLPKSEAISYDYKYIGVEGEGLIIRNEVMTSLSDYEKLDYEHLIDGQFAEDGTTVVTAYKKGYIQTTLSKLKETEKNIVEYQNQSIISGYDDKNITMLDFEIDVIIRRMGESSDGYIELYGELCEKMAERELYIKSNYNTEANTYLQQLYADELSLTESIDAWRNICKTDGDGFVCFYCDGLEALNADTINSLNQETFSQYINNASDTEISAYKLVNDGVWHICVALKDTGGLSVGAVYPLFIGNETESEAGTLSSIIECKKYNIAVFELNDNVEKYIDRRTETVHIGSRVEGYSLPTEYIKDNTVILKENKEKSYISVNILYSDKDITVFEPTESFFVGQKVYSK